jgi:DNA-binding NtrC family response regulator
MSVGRGETHPVVIAGRAGTEVVLENVRVLVEGGPDLGTAAMLTSTSLRIGTDPDNDLALTDLAVSRRHAVLTTTEQGLKIEDLNSRNGTVVNGTRIQVAYVDSGALVKVGNSVLRVTLDSGRMVVFAEKDFRADGMVVQSPQMHETMALVRQVARFDLPVLISGETGSGKEVVARALHDFSLRNATPLQILDCGGLVPDLFASKLFGHEKGAFTGADRMQKGIFEEASGGTVFLDEVGEIPTSLQAHLLRVLETKVVQRVGSNQSIPVNFRLVSATHRDLRAHVRSGQFRSDLLYRLSGVVIRIPPLRERVEDVARLARHFMERFAEQHGMEAPVLSSAAVEQLERHSWPGNVRELRNAAEALVATSSDRRISKADVARVVESNDDADTQDSSRGNLQSAEKTAILNALQSCRWQIKEAAARLGISRTTLYRKMREFNMTPPEKD